ncbi:hypothetical protein XENOCAPTIV_030742 [Xenoophorus captivus]|uniref:Secreted protein n=1 Tax=Xenoophorus captivus TaxID=1517983 RepID=A0ABV0Q7Y5_9TELE
MENRCKSGADFPIQMRILCVLLAVIMNSLHKANTLKSLRTLLLFFYTRSSICTYFVDQLCAHNPVCTCFYTRKPFEDHPLCVAISRDGQNICRGGMYFLSK